MPYNLREPSATTEYPCIDCGRNVRPRQQAVDCDTCGRWQHRTCKTNIPQRIYNEAKRSECTIFFNCKNCNESGVCSAVYIYDEPTGHSAEDFIQDESMGTLVIELYWKHAPNTCRNFAELARRGYYNGVKFHRIIKDFMIQGGDPTGTGRGGASIYGKQFDDEISEELKHTGAGILSMANSGANSNGSQFFITLAPTQWLDGKHTIFGRICNGMQVVQRIGMVETDNHDRPTDEIKIVQAQVNS